MSLTYGASVEAVSPSRATENRTLIGRLMKPPRSPSRPGAWGDRGESNSLLRGPQPRVIPLHYEHRTRKRS